MITITTMKKIVVTEQVEVILYWVWPTNSKIVSTRRTTNKTSE